MVEMNVGHKKVFDVGRFIAMPGQTIDKGRQSGAGAAFNQNGAVRSLDKVGGNGVRPILVMEVNGVDVHKLTRFFPNTQVFGNSAPAIRVEE
jgi:hypothetical protein